MADAAYGLFIAGTLASAVYLLRHLPRGHFSWRGFVSVVGVVSLPFILWDVWATRQGHWAFNDQFIVGPRIFRVPVEELLFFLAVPLVSLAVWLFMRHRTLDATIKHKGSIATVVGTVLFIILAITTAGKAYTQVVAAVGVLTCIVLLIDNRLIHSRQFWAYLGVMFVLFFLANTFLTALPIVTYDDAANLGLRLGTIPIEDFFYNFALVSLTVVLYENTK